MFSCLSCTGTCHCAGMERSSAGMIACGLALRCALWFSPLQPYLARSLQCSTPLTSAERCAPARRPSPASARPRPNRQLGSCSGRGDVLAGQRPVAVRRGRADRVPPADPAVHAQRPGGAARPRLRLLDLRPPRTRGRDGGPGAGAAGLACTGLGVEDGGAEARVGGSVAVPAQPAGGGAVCGGLDGRADQRGDAAQPIAGDARLRCVSPLSGGQAPGVPCD